MRDAGSSWAEIAKVRSFWECNHREFEYLADICVKQTFPTRTEGSVKKHWYKDMHYAEFAEDEVCFHIGNATAAKSNSRFSRVKPF
jgi:hypothetical protein